MPGIPRVPGRLKPPLHSTAFLASSDYSAPVLSCSHFLADALHIEDVAPEPTAHCSDDGLGLRAHRSVDTVYGLARQSYGHQVALVRGEYHEEVVDGPTQGIHVPGID